MHSPRQNAYRAAVPSSGHRSCKGPMKPDWWPDQLLRARSRFWVPTCRVGMSVAFKACPGYRPTTTSDKTFSSAVFACREIETHRSPTFQRTCRVQRLQSVAQLPESHDNSIGASSWYLGGYAPFSAQQRVAWETAGNRLPTFTGVSTRTHAHPNPTR